MGNSMSDNREQAARLTAQECSGIDQILSHYPVASGAAIDLLKMIQHEHGWVSDQHLRALAEYTHIPIAELESVATFYNLIFRKPVGNNVLHPCNGVSCLLMGYRQVHQTLTQTLGIVDGETTQDNAFTLIPLPCLGACDKAPVVLINDQLHEKVRPDQIDTIIHAVSRKAQPQ